jgi:hypothetical protein
MPTRLSAPARMTEDPLSLAIRPPIDESPEEKSVREQREKQAKAISDAIDHELKQARTVCAHSSVCFRV